jgi:hypothetical protein
MNLDFSQMCGVVPSRGPRQLCNFHAPIVRAFEWYDFAVPTYNQEYPSCVGHATANWIELMLRRFVGKDVLAAGEQVDGDAIWRRGREMFWNGTLDGGLLMDQGFAAAIDLGILPAKSQVLKVAANLGVVSQQLAKTPVLQGTAVHRGWSDPDPESGEISFDLPNPNAGHATCIVALVDQKGGNQIGSAFQNSWGKDWGRFGYGILREDQWLQCLLDDPVTCLLPDGWTSFDGWRRFVIQRPETRA